MDELRLEAGLGRHPPRGDGGVALLEQQLLGGVEQLGAGLGVRGTDATGRGGRSPRRHLATPADRMLSNCSALLCRVHSSRQQKETGLSDWQTIDFFTDESLVEDPYPYFDELRAAVPGAAAPAPRAWSR